MTLEQFRALQDCIGSERKGDVSTGPECYSYSPLIGVSKELVDLGYLKAHDIGDYVIGLTVTDAGFMAVAD